MHTSAASASKIRLLLAFAIVYIVWGSTYLGIKIALVSFPPFLLSSFRLLIAGAVLLILGKILLAEIPTKAQVINAAITGVILLGLANPWVAWTSQFVPSSIVALAITIEPVWVAIIPWLINKNERPKGIIIVGLCLGIIGMYFLVKPESGTAVGQISYWHLLVLMLCTISWAGGSIFSSKVNMPTSSFLSTGIQMFTAGLVNQIYAIGFNEWSQFDLSTIEPNALWAFFYLTLFGSIGGFSAYSYLVKNASPTSVATHAYVNPIVAVLLGYFIGNELIKVNTIVAAILLISAVVLILRKEIKASKKG